jgi:MinD-like ATPase involved in chromosome partitioning or flagellar assembly
VATGADHTAAAIRIMTKVARRLLPTEVIAFASGKGGTGKTSLTSSLGYALTYSGHNVLLIDADPATDGFSLFLLGPSGMNQIADYKPENTLTGFLKSYEAKSKQKAVPRSIHRIGSDDHNLSYNALISGRGLYGAIPARSESAAPLKLPAGGSPVESNFLQLPRETFQRAIRSLFEDLRKHGDYDYVLVDTRGGFSFESTDVCAAADSFIIVTEANYTSFYQDRNLIDRITEAAAQMQTRPLLRGVIINKATQGEEESFRAALVNEFGIRMEDTFVVALDFEAVKVYKTQQIIYVRAPASQFAFDSLRAFAEILRIVTGQWPEERVKKWNEIVEKVKAAISSRNQELADQETQAQLQIKRFEQLQIDNQRVQADLQNTKDLLEQTKVSSNELLETLKKQHAQAEQALQKERLVAEQNAREKQDELIRLSQGQEERLDYFAMKRGLEMEREFSTYRLTAEKRIQAFRLIIIFISMLAAAATSLAAYFLMQAKQQDVRYNKEMQALEDRSKQQIEELQSSASLYKSLYNSEREKPSKP